MAGCMGSAVATGLGMALSAPEKQVAVITGDGELQMGLGSLNTVATQAPAN
ncbi:MAG TPA: thiamine pyrophosphate-binding protein, partial [Rhodospirillaceae bacterium]|nr:thiamine pyrophosphate-binding protein [Rhodospirillaceae bacterium]